MTTVATRFDLTFSTADFNAALDLSSVDTNVYILEEASRIYRDAVAKLMVAAGHTQDDINAAMDPKTEVYTDLDNDACAFDYTVDQLDALYQ